MTKIKFPNGQIVDFKDRSREDILEQINALEETHPQLFKSEVEPKEVVVEIFPLSEYVSPNQTDGGDFGFEAALLVGGVILLGLLSLFFYYAKTKIRLFVFYLLSILGFGVGLADSDFSYRMWAEGVQHLVLVWLIFSAPLIAHLLWYKIFGAEVKNDKS